MLRTIKLALTLVLFCPLDARAAVRLDLAATPPELSAWGQEQTQLGASLAVADFNGDGHVDLAISEPYQNAPRDDGSVICLYWGRISFPFTTDRLVDTPSTCIHDLSAFGLAAADIDGDGIADLIGGSENATGGGIVWVFRGRASWPARLDVSDADWTFLAREIIDWLQFSAAGDLNGDGATDLVLFAPGGDGLGNLRKGSGEAYIFFGPASSWNAVIDLAVEASDVILYGADGQNDRTPFGIDADSITEFGGALISNVIGNSIADLTFGSWDATGAAEDIPGAGEVYVLRGRPVWPPSIDLRNPNPSDLIVYGPAANSHLYFSAVGDLDGDGKPDLVLGAPTASHGTGRFAPGAIYVFKGGALSGSRNLATSSADATIVGANEWANIGWRVGIGDVNGDGYPDIVTGGPRDSPLGRTSAGTISVLSGCDGFPRSRDLATDPAELAILGALYADSVGEQLALGDIDRDGKTDFLFGNPRTSSLGGLRPYGGEAHVVLGRPFDNVCTVTPDAGLPINLCGIADVTLNGSATTISGCSRTPEYRWLDGSTVVRDWAADPTGVVRPTSTTTFRLEVRCGDCAGPCFATANILVMVDPDILPPPLGNSLRAVRTGFDVALEWVTVPEARSFSIFRANQKDPWPATPWVENLLLPTTLLPDVPVPPNDPLYFYRAVGASCSGVEGP